MARIILETDFATYIASLKAYKQKTASEFTVHDRYEFTGNCVNAGLFATLYATEAFSVADFYSHLGVPMKRYMSGVACPHPLMIPRIYAQVETLLEKMKAEHDEMVRRHYCPFCAAIRKARAEAAAATVASGDDDGGEPPKQ